MKLILMRHGEAHSSTARDFDRNLTEYGKEEVEASARHLMSYKSEIDLMLVSPYPRARQTAELAAAILGDLPMLITDAVTPNVSVAKAKEELERQFESRSCLMVVMHQPIISSLVYYFTGIQQPMRTAAIAMIDAPVLERDRCILECVI